MLAMKEKLNAPIRIENSFSSKDSGCISIGTIGRGSRNTPKQTARTACHVRLAFRFKGRRYFSRYRRKYRLLFASRCECRRRDRKGDLFRAERAEFATVARKCPREWIQHVQVFP